jgi:hypothetical protein
MRFILGMIFGSLLTVLGVYVADSRSGGSGAASVGDTPTEASRPMVNWDVVGKRVDELTAETQTLWDNFTRQMTGPP